MSRYKGRMAWGKMWADSYLADIRVSKLSFAARGLLNHVWAILRTQVDEPGKFIVNGKPLTQPEIIRLLCSTAGSARSVGGGSRWVSALYQRCISEGIIVVSDDGIHHSPRIVKEFEESKLQSERRANRPDQRPDHRSYQTTDYRRHSTGATGQTTPRPNGDLTLRELAQRYQDKSED